MGMQKTLEMDFKGGAQKPSGILNMSLKNPWNGFQGSKMATLEMDFKGQKWQPLKWISRAREEYDKMSEEQCEEYLREQNET